MTVGRCTGCAETSNGTHRWGTLQLVRTSYALKQPSQTFQLLGQGVKGAI